MTNLVNRKYTSLFKKAQLWLGFSVLLLIISCQKTPKSYSISGTTMGTTYSIKIVENSSVKLDLNIIKTKADSVLQTINQQMSTYIDDSEISQFNNINTNDWFPISEHFYKVVVESINIAKLTDGAFDFTVGPLMDIWGFNNFTQDNWLPPTAENIANVLDEVGYRNIEIGNNVIRKLKPSVVIDVNAIAKGYAVDVVFELLENIGYSNILVEIGGEVRCSGTNESGESWKIGIDNPIRDNIPGSDLNTIISLNNNALATSGDYRNYIEYEGNLYSHTVNPITGYPTPNQVASASVIAPTCTKADALATALMVLGESGVELINSIDKVEAMVIIRTDDEKFRSIESDNWN